MARIARVDAAGAVHRVMVRGIERRQIFLGEQDRRDFVARLERVVPEEGWRSFAWALMPNHAHLVLQGSAGGLSGSWRGSIPVTPRASTDAIGARATSPRISSANPES